MFKDLKETIIKEAKKGMKTMSYQIKSINKETEIIKKDQLEILELKSITT